MKRVFPSARGTSSGGTNAAGDTITANGFDTILEINVGGDIRVNDDGGTGFDAWLTNAGIASQPNALPMTIPTFNGSYFLSLGHFNGTQTGSYAVDLVGPADAMVLGSIARGGTRIQSLSFGTNGDGEAAATYDEIGSNAVTVEESVIVAQTGSALLKIDNNNSLEVGDDIKYQSRRHC